jgi:hypothetical protein
MQAHQATYNRLRIAALQEITALCVLSIARHDDTRELCGQIGDGCDVRYHLLFVGVTVNAHAPLVE